MTARILPIVEGDGELNAVPLLLRNILYSNSIFGTEIMRAQKRGDIGKVRKNFERFLEAAQIEGAAIIWTFDCDDDCAKDVHAEFTERAKGVYCPNPIRFCFFVREYEALFLACIETLRGALPIGENIQDWRDPETIRNAKGTISGLMPKGISYSPTIDQARLTALLDFARLRATSRAFRHLEKSILELF